MKEEGMEVTRFLNIIIYGFQKALWEVMGEAAIAASYPVGKSMLEIMKKELGLKVAGEKPEDVLSGIAKRLTEDFKIAKEVKIGKSGDTITVDVEGCICLPVTQRLINTGIKPFACPFTNIAMAAMEELLGIPTGISSLEVSSPKCKIVFEMLRE